MTSHPGMGNGGEKRRNKGLSRPAIGLSRKVRRASGRVHEFLAADMFVYRPSRVVGIVREAPGRRGNDADVPRSQVPIHAAGTGLDLDRQAISECALHGGEFKGVSSLISLRALPRASRTSSSSKGSRNHSTSQVRSRRRGGRFDAFRGLPSYQAEGILADGRMSATRVFTAHGFWIPHDSPLGAKDPVEDDPKLEALMQGFEFTAPPEQGTTNTGSRGAQAPTRSDAQQQTAPNSDHGQAQSISEWMGQIVAVCIMAAMLLLFFRWAFGKRKPSKT